MNRLGTLLKTARGSGSRVQFARRLGLSYTFVRAMEHGQRFPSDPVLKKIAGILRLDPAELLLAAYCDRSPGLAEVLATRGVSLPAGAAPEDIPVPEASTAPNQAPSAAPTSAPAPQPAWQATQAARPF
ncbi:MAG: helix-turn-helix domain-containing protein [Planctomycetota bacterium]|jgi:transcriptional regulator with XRE-family HTH domain|nr:helix-turn-helix domain-containing protein [Planctomycetota bacterium]MDP6762662.1 helix-turn-helix domain-containing protein [Planctomycetota bacterium]MDP6989971.1 helix-turn-helix domain-containing protein [Planctomycetota bacterium]